MRAGLTTVGFMFKRCGRVAPDETPAPRSARHRPGFKCSFTKAKLSRAGFEPRSSLFFNRSPDFENLSSGSAGGSSVGSRCFPIFESSSSQPRRGSSGVKPRCSIYVKGSSVLAAAPPNRKHLLHFQNLLLRFHKEPRRFIKLLSHSSLLALRREFGSIRLCLSGICFGGENTPVPMPFALPIK